MTDQIFPSESHRTALLGTLRLLGVQHVTVDFSGSGDSGSITDVFLVGVAGANVAASEHRISWEIQHQVFSGGNWVTKVEQRDMSLTDAIKSVAYAAIESTGLDWYNNDGGQGTFKIDFTTSPPTIDLEIGINYTETTEHEFNFSGHEENEGDETCTPTTTA